MEPSVMPRLIDLTGKRFGKWCVLRRAISCETEPLWICECDCGAKHEVRGGHLRSGKSTGCFACRQVHIKHGQGAITKRTKKYKTWLGIKNRVTNPNQKNFERYSKLGLEPDWYKFAMFNTDVPDPPHPTSTIDRIDTTRGYFRGNVRWVSQKEQCRNRQGNVWIEFKGIIKLQSDWAKELNTDSSTLRRQIVRLGVDAAFAKHGAQHVVI